MCTYKIHIYQLCDIAQDFRDLARILARILPASQLVVEIRVKRN